MRKGLATKTGCLFNGRKQTVRHCLLGDRYGPDPAAGLRAPQPAQHACCYAGLTSLLAPSANRSRRLRPADPAAGGALNNYRAISPTIS